VKKHMLICYFIFMLVGKEKEMRKLFLKEWNSYKHRK
jgi:hypothetical protein